MQDPLSQSSDFGYLSVSINNPAKRSASGKAHRGRAVNCREIRVELDCFVVQTKGFVIRLPGNLGRFCQPTQIKVVGVKTFGWFTFRTLYFSLVYMGDKDGDDIVSHLVLNCEYVLQFSIVTFRPSVHACVCIDELGRDADPVAGAADTTFKDVTDPQLARDLTNVYSSTFVGEAGVSRDNEETGKPRELDCDVYTIAIDAGAIVENVSKVYADAKLHLTARFYAGIALGHCLLYRNRTLDRVNDARELCKDAVASRVDDPTTVSGDHWQYDGLVRLEVTDGRLLVGAHQRAVACDVGRDDRRQPAGNL